MKTCKQLINDERGFTLIEIIAVLIILGILAAVAVPKYFDISDEARKRAYEGATAEGLSLCSLSYSKAVLVKGGQPDIEDVFDALSGTSGSTTGDTYTAIADTTPGVSTSTGAKISGDFTLKFTLNSSDITIEAKAASTLGWPAEVAADTFRFKTWKMP